MIPHIQQENAPSPPTLGPAHSPINKLSPELLARILILSKMPISPRRQSSALCSLWMNAHLNICQNWRRLILRTPEYWKDIAIQLTFSGETETHPDESKTATGLVLGGAARQISFAKRHPVDLDLNCRRGLYQKDKDYEIMFKFFEERLPRIRLNTYSESGPIGVWNIIRPAMGQRFQDLTKLILTKPKYPTSGSDATFLPPVTDKNSCIEFPNLLYLALSDWELILPGTLQKFQAPELRTLKLSIISSATRFDPISVPGLLKDLQRFPILDTFMLYAKCLQDISLQFYTISVPSHLSVRNLSFGLSNPSPETHPASTAGHGSPLLSTLLKVLPNVTQLILVDLSYLGDSDVEMNENAARQNLGIAEIQIVSDANSEFMPIILERSTGTSRRVRGISEMSRFLSSLSNVRSLKLGSKFGRYSDGSVSRIPIGHYGDVRPDSDHPFVIHNDLDFVLTFLIKSTVHQSRTFLPSLELITLSKVTLNENILRTLQGILELRAGPAKKNVRTPSTSDPSVKQCRITFESCRYAAQCEQSDSDPRGFTLITGTGASELKYFRFPDREELDHRQHLILGAIFQEDLEEMEETRYSQDD